MKKLVMMAIIGVIATVSQAASINWTMTNVYSSSDSSAKGNGYSAYLFLTSNTSNVSGLTTTTLETVLALIGSTDWQSSVIGQSAANTKLTSTGGFLNVATGISSDFSEGSVSAFSIVFDAADIKDATHFYLVNNGEIKTVSFTSATGAKSFSYGSQATDSANSSNWQAIPEPTSAMLIVLGVAALALRRKRA